MLTLKPFWTTVFCFLPSWLPAFLPVFCARLAAAAAMEALSFSRAFRFSLLTCVFLTAMVAGEQEYHDRL